MHTMKQSFMFNSALNSQWNPLFSIEISFFDPHSLKNLITRFACYYSLRSYPQLASLVIRFLSLWGSKNEISLSTKWIPLFVANTVKQKPLLHYTAHCSTLFFTIEKIKMKNHSSQNIIFKQIWTFLDNLTKIRKKSVKKTFFSQWKKQLFHTVKKIFNSLWKKHLIHCEKNNCFTVWKKQLF